MQLRRTTLAPPVARAAEVPPPIEIVAEDGGARLLIPPSALPAGVSESDILISRIEAAEIAGTIDGAAPLVGYRLEPDGLALRAPATIVITTEFVGQDVPLLLHVASFSVELARNQSVEIDAVAGLVTVAGEIVHLSAIGLSPRGFFKVELTGPSVANVGETFKVDITLSKTDKPWVFEFDAGPRVSTFRALSPWHTGGGLDTSGRFVSAFELRPNPLRPYEIKYVPPPRWRRQPSVSASVSFTCVEAGNGLIIYAAKILFPEEEVFAVISQGSRGGKVLHRSIDGAGTTVGAVLEVECKLPVTGGTGTTGDTFPEIGELVITLDPPFTTYVVKMLPRDALTFKWHWSRSADACGKFRATRNVATWYHPHSKETGCSLGTSHPGTVAVVYSQDGKFGMKRYEGTETGRVP